MVSSPVDSTDCPNAVPAVRRRSFCFQSHQPWILPSEMSCGFGGRALAAHLLKAMQVPTEPTAASDDCRETTASSMTQGTSLISATAKTWTHLHCTVGTTIRTLDEQHPAPPENSWKDDSRQHTCVRNPVCRENGTNSLINPCFQDRLKLM